MRFVELDRFARLSTHNKKPRLPGAVAYHIRLSAHTMYDVAA